MGVAYSSLTDAQKTALAQFVDPIYRPVMGKVVRLLKNEAQALLNAALASPSSQPSTAAAPASDSIWGVLLSLTGTETIPISTSGYAGISPLQAQLIIQNLTDIAAVVAAHTTDQALQNFILIVGAGNMMGGA